MDRIPAADREVLRDLARQTVEAAAEPVNEQRRKFRRAVENMEAGRPVISIFQEPWNELELSGELGLQCEHGFCRGIERGMRRTLYKWRHYPGDMTIGTTLAQPLCIRDTGFGIEEKVDFEKMDPTSSIRSRHFHIQIADEADIAKIKKPVITHDETATEEQFQARSEIFDGLLTVHKRGIGGFWFAPWDQIVRWTGVQEVLMDLVLRPDYVHKLVSHLVDCWLSRVDQLEEQGLLACAANEMGVSGAAQIFSEVSPEMHGEFALQHEARFYKRFKRVHYGCCEPLHNKVDICAEYLPNMYQISMSPWVDFETGARKVGSRFIFGWRPNPAFLAHDHWDRDFVRSYLEEKLAIAHEHGCTVAIYLKDISTIHREPQRLDDWNAIAKECVAKYE